MKWKQQQQQQQQQVWGRRNWGKIGLPAVFLLCSLFFVAGLFGSSFLSHDMPSIKSPPRLLESNQEEDPISSLAHDSDDDLNDSKKNPHDGDDDNNNDRDLDNYKMKKPHDGDDDNIHDLDNYKMKKPHDGDDDNIHDLDNYKMAYGLTGEPNIDSIPFQVLSWKPRALYFPNFATADQCRSIIDMAKTRLKPSKLALRKGETAASTKGIRTSSGTFVSASEDSSGVLEAVEYKIARACMIPRSHGEAFNILRYKIGQRYVSHYDAFNPAEYGPQKSQRMASFLLYLSDVEEGGETMFPFENGANMDIGYDYEKCIGLKVKPRRGDGLLFYSLLPNGTIDQTSLHGSCPVIKGEKWVATKWIRDQHQNNS